VTQGKGTTAGDLSTSLKKSDNPAAKKKVVTPSTDSGDADSPMAAASKAKSALGGAAKGGGGPKIYTCYMCGQGFSGSSLGIHQPKCQQKWLAEQAAKPAGNVLHQVLTGMFCCKFMNALVYCYNRWHDTELSACTRFLGVTPCCTT